MTHVWSCFCVFVGLFVLRVWGIDQHFFLLGEQTRDWSIALGPFHALPLAGPPSTLGGRSLGPVYCWVLWAIRVTIGPALDHLPHAAGVGLAALQSAADAFLFFALWRRVGSPWIALAPVALSAAGPFDLGMSSLIWNPPVASALAKTAMALFLVGERGSRPMLYATMGTAWLAVQAHATALFVAAPIFGWLIGRELAAREWRAMGAALRAAFDCVVVLQIPYALHLLTAPDAEAPATRAIAALAAAPGSQALTSLVRSCAALAARTSFLLTDPWPWPAFAWILGSAVALVCWRARRDPPLLVVTALPLAMAALVSAPWREPETYWYLVVGSPAAMTLVLGFSTFGPRRVTNGLAIGLLVALMAAAPARYAGSMNATFFRFPAYGSLVQASRDIIRHQGDIRDIRTSFELPPSTDAAYLFSVLGGRLNPDGEFVALVAADGTVTYVRAAR